MSIIEIMDINEKYDHFVFYNYINKKIYDSWRCYFKKNMSQYGNDVNNSLAMQYYDLDLFNDDNMFENNAPQQLATQGFCTVFAMANAVCMHRMLLSDVEERLTTIKENIFKQQLNESCKILLEETKKDADNYEQVVNEICVIFPTKEWSYLPNSLQKQSKVLLEKDKEEALKKDMEEILKGNMKEKIEEFRFSETEPLLTDDMLNSLLEQQTQNCLNKAQKQFKCCLLL